MKKRQYNKYLKELENLKDKWYGNDNLTQEQMGYITMEYLFLISKIRREK